MLIFVLVLLKFEVLRIVIVFEFMIENVNYIRKIYLLGKVIKY